MLGPKADGKPQSAAAPQEFLAAYGAALAPRRKWNLGNIDHGGLQPDVSNAPSAYSTIALPLVP